MRKNPNKSNYHYRTEITDENGDVKTKFYFTLKDICEEYKTSTFTIYRIMKKGIVPTSPTLKNIKIYKDYKPAFVLVENTFY